MRNGPAVMPGRSSFSGAKMERETGIEPAASTLGRSRSAS